MANKKNNFLIDFLMAKDKLDSLRKEYQKVKKDRLSRFLGIDEMIKEEYLKAYKEYSKKRKKYYKLNK